MTSNDEYAKLVDQYTDHGHDHIGSDRGAETHPYLGYNFRISELHAAVGLAQVRRTDEFLALQRRNFAIIEEAINEIPEVTMRTIPDPEGNSGAFINFFMPTAEATNKVVEAFKSYGIDAFWNYFNNNWHYIKKWDHLKDVKSLFPISDQLRESLAYLKTADFSQSDDYISRNISCLIKLSWSEDEVRERAKKMAAAIRSTL